MSAALAIDLFCGFQAYAIRCLVDGKVYVGITSRSIRQRWNEHLYESRRGRARMTVAWAIARHGADNFRIEPVCCARSWEDATKAKIAAAKTGVARSEETKEKIRKYWAARRASGEFKTLRPYDHYARGAA